ncbi:MAG: hypothetical protein QNK24_10815, partial [Desulfuromusa sp.]|nr:hypothetical protein [Desulfuromusa sp.]
MKNLVKILVISGFIIFACSMPLFAQNPPAQKSLATGQFKQKILLTPEEQNWLKTHPDIQFGFAENFEPFFILNKDGTHSGVLVDI